MIKSNNQILISYYLKDGQFGKGDIDILKENDDDQHWFQSYHLILYSEDLLADIEKSIAKYLIPKKVNNENKKKSYMEFYKENLKLKNSIIRDITDVLDEIKDYLKLRIEESEAAFGTEEDEDMDI